VIAVSPSCWLPLAPDLTGCGQHEPAGPRQTRLSAEPFKFTRFSTAARSHPHRGGSPPPPRRPAIYNAANAGFMPLRCLQFPATESPRYGQGTASRE